jgi:hypothetical protein
MAPDHDRLGRVSRVIAYLVPDELHGQLLILLIAASFTLRMLWLSQPDGALIFDEKYYVVGDHES